MNRIFSILAAIRKALRKNRPAKRPTHRSTEVADILNTFARVQKSKAFWRGFNEIMSMNDKEFDEYSKIH